MPQSIIGERNSALALDIVRLFRKLQDKKEFVVSKQLLRSGTSIGANVEEASAAQSRNVFACKMRIASKEARETMYWLRLLQESGLVEVDVGTELQNIDEIIRILTSIVKTTRETPAQ